MAGKHKALIVDDQRGIMEILGAILSSLDHDYDYARTQREARELLKTNRYCYILLDLEFPADDGVTARIQTGFNCLAEIRERYHRDDLPVIVMTAHEKGTEYPISPRRTSRRTSSRWM
jgi:CheY-like chemotaxis protein